MAAREKQRKPTKKTPGSAGKRRPASPAVATASPPQLADAQTTLAIDIGGEGTKMLVLDPQGAPINERTRVLTPKPAEPRALLSLIEHMASEQPHFVRVSCGFPGVVVHGVVRTAPNLGTERWQGFPLESALHEVLKRPVRVMNDADLQGYGVIRGTGVELVLTLGTGLGSALFVDGRLVPNLEFGHHPFRKGRTYEESVSNAELHRIGRKRWSRRVARAIAQLGPIFNYETLHLGGGNARHLTIELPEDVRLFTNVDGLGGGVRLWQ